MLQSVPSHPPVVHCLAETVHGRNVLFWICVSLWVFCLHAVQVHACTYMYVHVYMSVENQSVVATSSKTVTHICRVLWHLSLWVDCFSWGMHGVRRRMHWEGTCMWIVNVLDMTLYCLLIRLYYWKHNHCWPATHCRNLSLILKMLVIDMCNIYMYLYIAALFWGGYA